MSSLSTPTILPFPRSRRRQAASVSGSAEPDAVQKSWLPEHTTVGGRSFNSHALIARAWSRTGVFEKASWEVPSDNEKVEKRRL